MPDWHPILWLIQRCAPKVKRRLRLRYSESQTRETETIVQHRGSHLYGYRGSPVVRRFERSTAVLGTRLAGCAVVIVADFRDYTRCLQRTMLRRWQPKCQQEQSCNALQ